MVSSGYGPVYTWRTWDPILVNMTKGDGTIVSRFTQIDGKLIIAQFEFIFGASSTMGSAPTISTPVTARASFVNERMWLGGVVFLDTTAGNTPSGIVRLATVDRFEPLALDASATYLVDTQLSSIIPFTWTAGDMLSFTAFLEAA